MAKHFAELREGQAKVDAEYETMLRQLPRVGQTKSTYKGPL